MSRSPITLLLLSFLFLNVCRLNANVYDCFPFFNELELLKLRLDELNSVVDYFVLVESIETQRGDPKPLYFKDNKHLFEKYLHKIIHVVINERHPEMGLWEREHYQRECILRGLKRCNPWDQILISDLDEIPKVSVIANLKNKHSPNRKKKPGHSSYEKTFSLQLDSYFFQLNRQTPTGEAWGGGLWFGTVVTSFWKLAQYGPQYFRDRRADFHKLWHVGWHFSWMGGIDKIRQKLLSVVEGRPMSDEEIIEWTKGYITVPIDSRFPRYIFRNQNYLRSIGFIE